MHRSTLRPAPPAAALAVAALLLALPSPAAAALAWEAKVDTAVLEQAALGDAEFLIYLAEKADLSPAYDLATKEEKGAFVHAALTGTAATSQAGLLAQLALLGIEHRSIWVTNAVWARGDLAVVEAVASRLDVARVFAVGFGGVEAPAPADTSAAETVEWNIALTGAPDVWALGYTGQGVVVAGADTGVFWEHTALREQYRGWDGTTAVHDYNWHDAIHNPNTACPGSSPEPCDDDAVLGGGHGTHTMGTIVGDDGGANRIGMAPGADWIACRNMNNGVGAVPSYLECMEWFIAPTDGAGEHPDPGKAPHVINNSWGCVEACPPPLLRDQLEASRAAGIVYVVSAGNDGSQCSTMIHPLAIYEGAFSVGATDRNDQIAGFSSRGPVLNDVPNPPRVGPDISAPGVAVRSALRNGSYGALSGTSMAGPHVAGLVALLISADPSLAGDVERIEQIVMERAHRLFTAQGCGDDTPTSVPNNSFGWGRIDALASILAVLGRSAPPVAVDDTATTGVGTPVTIDALANDYDPDGDALSVVAVGSPSAGGAAEHDGTVVTYTPAPGFSGTETFPYTISDGESTASATITVEVVCPTTSTVAWSDDLEPAPEPGWSHDTAANAVPASATWAALPDPFAHSPQSSYFSDATTLDLKDDRLVSPPLDLTAGSHLAFWHRFDFEGGFDGGVLEVSTDGGASWADVLSGGTFVEGGYDHTIAPNFDSPIAGRAAWSGASSSQAAMERVEVDLGAFAGSGVRVRWRLAADPLALGATPGLGWWIDDVDLLEVTEVCPQPPRAVDDSATTREGQPVTIDVLANDVDPDGQALQVTSVTQPANGSATIEPDSRVTYQPDAGFVGTDSFSYEACDEDGLCDVANVDVQVSADPHPAPADTASGGGAIADGTGDGRFTVNLRLSDGVAEGRVSYRADGLDLRGTATRIAFPDGSRADASGSCTLGDGSTCSFSVAIDDAAEPGAGRDRFAIEVRDAAGAVVHRADGLLLRGNLQVR